MIIMIRKGEERTKMIGKEEEKDNKDNTDEKGEKMDDNDKKEGGR